MATVSTGHDSKMSELAFPPTGELETLVDRLHVAIARDEPLIAFELMQALKNLLGSINLDAIGRAIEVQSAANEDLEQLAARTSTLYIDLADAGSTVVDTLAEWYSPREARLTLARGITLEWFDEAMKWRRLRDMSRAYFLLRAA